jgi:hypothetical protein
VNYCSLCPVYTLAYISGKPAQYRFNKDTQQQTIAWVGNTLLPSMQRLLDDVTVCSLHPRKQDNILIRYPAAFRDDYLRPEVLLEISSLSAWSPSESRRIRSYAAEHFPQLFDEPDREVQVISAKRTFWDKATHAGPDLQQGTEQVPGPRLMLLLWRLWRIWRRR